MVSVVRCAGVWTNNKCCLLDWTKTIISLTWLLPMTNITYFLTLRWSSEEHVRTGYICWFFCGVKEMLHVSPILSKFIRCQHESWIYEFWFFRKTVIGHSSCFHKLFFDEFYEINKIYFAVFQDLLDDFFILISYVGIFYIVLILIQRYTYRMLQTNKSHFGHW